MSINAGFSSKPRLRTPEGKQFNKHQQPEKYWGTPPITSQLHVWDFAASSMASAWHWSEWGKWSFIPAQKKCSHWKIVSGCGRLGMQDVGMCYITFLSRKADSLNAASSFWHGSGRERLRGPPAIPWSPFVLAFQRHWNHTGDSPRPMSQWFSRTQSV